MRFITDLDAKLLKLAPNDYFTLRDACAGVHFTGRIGGGKTTASGILARAFLRAGFGGNVTAAKPGEVELWKQYCREEGRSQSQADVEKATADELEARRTGPVGSQSPSADRAKDS
jgi:hypothetical protein